MEASIRNTSSPATSPVWSMGSLVYELVTLQKLLFHKIWKKETYLHWPDLHSANPVNS